MRGSSRALTAMLVGATMVGVSGCAVTTSASGSCALREIRLDDHAVRPGAEVRAGGEIHLSVDWMTTDCEDTGATRRAARHFTVTITPTATGHVYRLGRVDAATGRRFTVAGRLVVPDGVPAGAATLAVTSADSDFASASTPVTVGAR